MRRIRIRLRIKIYPFLWSIIILISVYLLIRFAMISFSDEMGQAGFGDAMISKLCIMTIEAGPSFVTYTAEEDINTESFPISLIKEEMALGKFIIDDTVLTVEAHDYLESFDSKGVSKGEVIQASQNEVKNINEIGIYQINSDEIGKEYILTNGAVLLSDTTGVLIGATNLILDQLSIGYLEGKINKQSSLEEESSTNKEAVETATVEGVHYTLEKLKDINFLIRNFYIVDASTKVSETIFNAEELLNKDMTMKQKNDAPQILIYHTHSKEAFIDSRVDKESDTVVGVGSYLTKLLEEEYGYNVIHDTTAYDIVDGKQDRNVAYSQAEDGVTKILEDNPSIEVIIDLHRNSGEAKTVTIDGVEVAQIMLFNGLSRDQNGPITYLDNPYLQDNLAFSLQLQLKSLEEYPGLFKKNYLKCYRYNMHLRPKCMLMELGTVNNTLQSAKNAMVPFAKLLDEVLKGDITE